MRVCDRCPPHPLSHRVGAANHDFFQERERISRFKFRKDAKLALVGRLLLQHAACSALGQPFGMADFGRTKERKPFLSHTTPHGKGSCCCSRQNIGERGGQGPRNQEVPSEFCHFNVNLSHHGSWVFLAADSKQLVGADVMTISPLRADEPPESFFRDFTNCLTCDEWNAVRSCEPFGPSALFRAFFVFWTLKESYIKAVGIGLGLDLMRIEFHVPMHLLLGEVARGGCDGSSKVRAAAVEAALDVGAVKMSLDGAQRPDWTFEVGQLDAGHIIAVAGGPLEDAVPSFRDALSNCQRGFECGSGNDGGKERDEDEESVEEGEQKEACRAGHCCALCVSDQQMPSTPSRGSALASNEAGEHGNAAGESREAEGERGSRREGTELSRPGALKVKVLTIEDLLSTSSSLLREFENLP